jgi:acyl-CoA dehydrogenase
MTASLSWRARTITKPILSWYRKLLPPISPTERDAIAAGTVWWDADLFSGKPPVGKIAPLCAAASDTRRADLPRRPG